MGCDQADTGAFCLRSLMMDSWEGGTWPSVDFSISDDFFGLIMSDIMAFYASRCRAESFSVFVLREFGRCLGSLFVFIPHAAGLKASYGTQYSLTNKCLTVSRFKNN